MTEQHPLVSVVVTTRNEERNIVNCLKSIAAQTWPNVEVIVVDNQSTDKTKELARRITDKVFEKGPERSAQRNFGITQVASGEYAMFVDADMLLAPSLVEKCVEAMQEPQIVALHVDEIVLGRGLLARIRRFERSFYSGTIIDGIRFFKRDLFIDVGGFDEHLPPGPEDWDLDKRFKQHGNLLLVKTSGGAQTIELDEFVKARGVKPQTGFVGIYHNEDAQTLTQYLAKKTYYSGGLVSYRAKWGSKDADIRLQLSPVYRLAGVFVEKGRWRKLAVRPDLALSMLILRLLVGIRYFLATQKRRAHAQNLNTPN